MVRSDRDSRDHKHLNDDHSARGPRLNSTAPPPSQPPPTGLEETPERRGSFVGRFVKRMSMFFGGRQPTEDPGSPRRDSQTSNPRHQRRGDPHRSAFHRPSAMSSTGNTSDRLPPEGSGNSDAALLRESHSAANLRLLRAEGKSRGSMSSQMGGGGRSRMMSNSGVDMQGYSRSTAGATFSRPAPPVVRDS